MSKPSYSTYVKDRLNGFEGESVMPMRRIRDEQVFPGFGASNAPNRSQIRFPACNGPISLKDPDAVKRDIANLKAATKDRPIGDVFMTAVSPGQIARFWPML